MTSQTRVRTVEIGTGGGLDDYATIVHLSPAVRELRAEASALVPRLGGRKVWMVSSTAKGGGVAEMLPKMVTLLRELGVDVDWVVLETGRSEFFEITKRIHNLIHGVDQPRLDDQDRELYERVNREVAQGLSTLVGRQDLLVVHDPQPLAAGSFLKEELGLPTLWRCHIGLDERTPHTSTVWSFLKPYAVQYDHSIFSAPEYIPSFLAQRCTVVTPAIDPLGDKNRELSVHKLVGILANASLVQDHTPVLTPPFSQPALRLHADGHWFPANQTDELGLLTRPIVVQVSRWDRLKGFAPLMDAFVRLKQSAEAAGRSETHRRRLRLLRLVLAGPDAASVADDPEGSEVLAELERRYRSLSPEQQEDVALLTLPMASRQENALMVNALQRCATVVVQNSLREGFGLTVSEAMWKRVPVIGSRACGIRQQIRDHLDGRLVENPEDPVQLAALLDELLADTTERERLARAAQRRVHESFLVFTQLGAWLRLLVEAAEQPAA